MIKNVIGLAIPFVLMAALMIFMYFNLGNGIEEIDQKLEDPNYCNQVYDRPDEFNPEEGTVDEKYDYCINYIENHAEGFKNNLVMMQYLILFSPLIVGLVVIVELWRFGLVGKRKYGTDANDRTEYDPGFKGYGKDNKPRFDV